MAIIPLRQTVTIKPTTGSTDRFNRPVYGTAYSLPCRIEEETKLVRSRSGGMTTNAEAVSSAHIFLGGFVNVQMDDEITYRDDAGNVKSFSPITVEVKRGLDGRAILTVVYV